MSQKTFLLVRAHVPALKTEMYWRVQQGIAKRFADVDSVMGPSLYCNVERPEILLAVLEIADAENFTQGAAEWLDDAMILDMQKATDGTESVRQIMIRHAVGTMPHAMSADTFLSISNRTAEPGRADELAEDYEMVFGSLSMIKGFKGYAYGAYGALDEQIYGLAMWETEEGFRSSVSKTMRNEVRFYRKMHESEMRVGSVDFLADKPDAPAAS